VWGFNLNKLAKKYWGKWEAGEASKGKKKHSHNFPKKRKKPIKTHLHNVTIGTMGSWMTHSRVLEEIFGNELKKKKG